MDAQFEKAVEDVKKCNPSDERKLRLYGYYKVVKCGKCSGSCPSKWLDPKGNYKWNAWNKVSDLSKEDAMIGYIKLVEKIKG